MAGSVVASRLSETGASVLVLEAGEDATPESAIPGLSILAALTDNNWKYESSKPTGNTLLGLSDRVSRSILTLWFIWT